MRRSFFEAGKCFASLLAAVAGFVPEGATVVRIVSFSIMVALSYWLASTPPETVLAGVLFGGMELCYLGTLVAVLRPEGLRRRFVARWGEEGGFHKFQTLLGPLFYAQAFALSYLATATAGSLSVLISHTMLSVTAISLFTIGSVTKLWAAHVVTVDIYYWKDMFVGHKISEFVGSGPYRWLKNPMYGVGQLPAYAVALWYGSLWGLVAAIMNQGLIFLFFYMVEKPFMRRVYGAAPA